VCIHSPPLDAATKHQARELRGKLMTWHRLSATTAVSGDLLNQDFSCCHEQPLYLPAARDTFKIRTNRRPTTVAGDSGILRTRPDMCESNNVARVEGLATTPNMSRQIQPNEGCVERRCRIHRRGSTGQCGQNKQRYCDIPSHLQTGIPRDSPAANFYK
jgi:hypothetical protein